MHRTQVYLTETQHRRLAAMAHSLGLTLAELIRQGVDLVLREKAALGRDPLLALVGQAGAVGDPELAASHEADHTPGGPGRERS